MTSQLLSWFEKRRKSKTLVLAQSQMMKAINTVNDLEKGLSALYEGNNEEVETRIERLFQEEAEIDELRRAVFEELTKGELPTKFREDLKSLVRRLDSLADHIKDGGRSIKILVEAKANIPKEILHLYLKMAQNLVKCTQDLNRSIEMLGTNPSKAKEFAKQVDIFEGLIDEEHLNLKIMFIKNAEKLITPTLMILKDLVESIEHAADMCADTADYVRTLAINEI